MLNDAYSHKYIDSSQKFVLVEFDSSQQFVLVGFVEGFDYSSLNVGMKLYLTRLLQVYKVKELLEHTQLMKLGVLQGKYQATHLC